MSTLSTSEPRRFLFVLLEGGGSVPPQLAVARQLVQRGHSVRVLADLAIREDAEAAGARFVPFTRAPQRPDRSPESMPFRDWEMKTPRGWVRLLDQAMFEPALRYAEDVLEELSREEAHVAVVDVGLLGAMMAAEKAQLPTAVMMHSAYMLPAPGIPAPGPGFLPARGPLGRLRDAIFSWLFLRIFATGLPKLNRARAALGLEPVANLREVFDRADRVLVLTSRAFDFEATALPANVRYVGPPLEDPAWTGSWDSPWPADHPDPLVVVSFSTMPQGQAELLQRVIDALGEMRVRVLVTTGHGIAPESLRAPGNVVVRHAAPHAQVFPETSAVVTHAGHGTVIRALAAGLPLVCLPMGRDQHNNAARVVYRGVGVRLSMKASAAKIRNAVTEVLEDPRYRERAQRMARQIAEEVRRDDAVRELEALASRGRVAR